MLINSYVVNWAERPRFGALTAIGGSFLAFVAVGLISLVFHIPDALILARCGAAPALNYPAVERFFAYSTCKNGVDTSYWMSMAFLTGACLGFAERAWFRREARREIERDKALGAEMARIRAELAQKL